VGEISFGHAGRQAGRVLISPELAEISSGQAGRVLISPELAKFRPVSWSSTDLTELANFSLDQAGRLCGMPY